MKLSLLWLLALLLSWPAQAQPLSPGDPHGKLWLEFAQQGEPQTPRALIVIHRALADRSDLKPLYQRWSGPSWAVRQYCSVYTYEYPAGLTNLATPADLGQDLLNLVNQDLFDRNSGADPVNPYRSLLTDARQPRPSFHSSRQPLQIMVIGIGYGGLVAREFVLQGKKSGLTFSRVAYVGAPLDGVSWVQLLTLLTHPKACLALGLQQPADISRLGPGWRHLARLRDGGRGWAGRYAPVYSVNSTGAYGGNGYVATPLNNIDFGANRPISNAARREFDGLVTRLGALGQNNGPVSSLLVGAQGLQQVHQQLAGDAGVYTMAFNQMLNPQILYQYLQARQNVEEYFGLPLKPGGKKPKPSGIYWDERNDGGHLPQWRSVFAPAESLYHYLWETGGSYP